MKIFTVSEAKKKNSIISEEDFNSELLDEAGDRNNAFIDFFNESGLLKST